MTCIIYFERDSFGLQSVGGAPMLEIPGLTRNNARLLILRFFFLVTIHLLCASLLAIHFPQFLISHYYTHYQWISNASKLPVTKLVLKRVNLILLFIIVVKSKCDIFKKLALNEEGFLLRTNFPLEQVRKYQKRMEVIIQ